MKFKVGDKVKFIGKTTDHSSFWEDLKADIEKYNNVFTIAYVSEGYVEFEENSYWCIREHEIELVQEKQFTKADLKNGDIVTYRNGNKRTVISGKLIDEKEMRSNYLRSYNDRMEDEDGYRNLDIVKVERPIKYETVFERKEEILDETEKKYLANIIRPFRKKVRYIIKYGDTFKEYIAIVLQNEHISLPFFHKSTMYKGMKEDKEYTLKELGL